MVRQVEVGIEGAEILQCHDGGARHDVLAFIDEAHPQPAGERRAHDLLIEHRALFRDSGFGILEVGRIDIERGAADGLGFELLHIAFILRAGELRRSLQGFETRLLVLDAQLHEGRSGFHLLAGFEIDLVDNAGGFHR